jgi:hypothetical protein
MLEVVEPEQSVNNLRIGRQNIHWVRVKALSACDNLVGLYVMNS